ncbi:hypothetical protein Barb4_01392 [Bacteroidales bacterium Barb4]|nr:hypothetical protein Barb4_01392 [Bacteroidales bacterium Barb4]
MKSRRDGIFQPNVKRSGTLGLDKYIPNKVLKERYK